MNIANLSCLSTATSLKAYRMVLKIVNEGNYNSLQNWIRSMLT